MSIGSFAVSGLVYVLSMFTLWLSIFFVIPVKNPLMLWILIPIWVNFLFTEIYQEKRGTSMGNAVTNAAVMLWVGIDWARLLVNAALSKELLLVDGIIRFSICFAVFAFGTIILIQGIRGKKAVRLIARVRETSYIMLVFSPIIYGAVPISLKYVLSVIVFFPIFYAIFEAIARFMPNPKTYNTESSDKKDDFGKGLFDKMPSFDQEKPEQEVFQQTKPKPPLFQG